MDPKKTKVVESDGEKAREETFSMPTISVEEAPSTHNIFQFSPNSSVSRKQYEEDKNAFIVAEKQEPETFDPLSPSKEDEQSTILKRRMTVPACINTFRRALSE